MRRKPVFELPKNIIYSGKYSYGIENIKLLSWQSSERLHIGSFNSISANVTVFLGGGHRLDWLTTYPFGHIHNGVFDQGLVNGFAGHPVSKGDVYVQNDVWIGYGATILSGVTLGNGSCVAAMSVVTKNVAPYAVVAGNPARVIKHRFPPGIVELLLGLEWWNLHDKTINLIIPYLQCPCNAESLSRVFSLLSEQKQEQ